MDAKFNPAVKTEVLAEVLELHSPDADEFCPHEDLPARLARWCVQAIVVALIAMMGIEMLVRSAFGWSIQVSNEIGGYALIAITFLSPASGLLLHAFHRVHFLDQRVGRVAQARLRLVFNFAAAVVTTVLLVEMVRFEWLTWNSGDVAATTLMTPLWIPRLAMPVGTALLLWALLRTLAGDWRRLRAASAARA
ncbi:TRAP-type C4-dicarboxylate transport system, small permease component [Variovorax sp. HW608]|uniref:TRAP transporter small permease n=1 Tax=Variovorax sp. HW608 TaxID=1034889 RepID=UPI00081F96FC|nr:TRAP transporter small permease subunit [Variovorax sp. HW608]SCK19274.1 TRAP-type C4-dicarboxylate transport system, small permease component [Variovorax sp. HW608]